MKPSIRGSIFNSGLPKKSALHKIQPPIQQQVLDPQEQIAQNYDISVEEVNQLQKCFRRYDLKKIDAIQWYEVDDVYRDMDIVITDTIRDIIVKTMRQHNAQSSDFNLVIIIYKEIQKQLQKEQEELEQVDTINAFVAMGGNHDRSGNITKKIIIDTIKNDFQLNFDIEGFLEKQGIFQQEQLDYEDFQKIFEGNEEAKEMLSTFSGKILAKKRNYEQDQDSIIEDQEFNVDYKEFLDWQKQQDEYES